MSKKFQIPQETKANNQMPSWFNKIELKTLEINDIELILSKLKTSLSLMEQDLYMWRNFDDSNPYTTAYSYSVLLIKQEIERITKHLECQKAELQLLIDQAKQ